MASEHFRAKDIGLKAQKKFLSRMSTKSTIRLFIDDRSASVLDNMYKLFKQYTGNKKEAEKLIKSIIKTIVKIGILHRNHQFNSDEMEIAAKLPQAFQKVVMTVASYYEIDFSYDYVHLLRLLSDLHTNLRLLIRNHLTEKSLSRLNSIFQYTTKKEFCDSVFLGSSPYRDMMGKIIFDLTTILDDTKEH